MNNTNSKELKKVKLHDDDWSGFKKDESFFVKNKISRKRIKNIIKIFKKFNLNNISLLDIGCGSGYLIKELNKNKIKIKYSVGLDISKNAIAKAIRRFNSAYVWDIDSGKLPEKSNFFNVVICSEVIEHIYDVENCLSEAKRVIKKSGFIVITTPNLGFIKYRLQLLLGKTPSIIKDQRHLHTFTSKFLTAIIKKVGLKIIRENGSIENSPLKNVFELILNDTIILILKK